MYNQPGVASLLIEASARLDIPYFGNKTAMDYIVESENQEIQKLLKIVKLLRRWLF